MLGFGTAPSAFLLQSQSGFCGAQIACAQRNVSVRQDCGSNVCRRLIVHCGRRGGGRDSKRRGDGRRSNRVGELIRREISAIIDDAFARSFSSQDSTAPVLVSVVDVRCSDDLRNARVSVSVLGTDEEKNSALRWLRGARKELRYELAQCVHLKYIPELSFTESEMAQAVKTVDILNMLAKEREEKQLLRSKQAAGVGTVHTGAASTATESDLDMDASADDALILDDLDIDGLIDEEDEADDALIVDVTDEDEDLEVMSDDKVRSVLFNTLAEEDFVP